MNRRQFIFNSLIALGTIKAIDESVQTEFIKIPIINLIPNQYCSIVDWQGTGELFAWCFNDKKELIPLGIADGWEWERKGNDIILKNHCRKGDV